MIAVEQRELKFQWDEKKESTNRRKHDISFLEASEVFGDDYSSYVQDPDHSNDEERYLLFGASLKGKHLVVSFTERADTLFASYQQGA